MDARWLAAGAATAATLAALGLVAVALSGQPNDVAPPHPAPLLIARADPVAPPAAPEAPKPPRPEAIPPLFTPAPAAPSKPPHLAATEAPAALPTPPTTSRPLVAALPPRPTIVKPPPPPPAPKPPVVDHRYDGVLTVAEIGRIRRALKLSPDQEPYWPPIASILREVGRRQMDQIDTGRQPTFDLPDDLSSRLYSAVGPLLGTLRDDQKDEVRRRAKMLGLDSVASFI